MLSRSCAPSPMLAPSPSTTGPISRTPSPMRTSRPIHAGPSSSVSSRSGEPPATITPGPHLLALDLQVQLAAQRVEGALRAAPPSEPTSFQYSRISWMWKGTSFSSSTGKTSLAQSTNGPVGEVVEDLGVEHVDAAVAEVRQRLLGRGLLLKAGDAPVAVVQHDAVLARVGHLLDGERRDPAGFAVPVGERRRGRCR